MTDQSTKIADLEGDSVAALKAMASNYPDGHLWDYLDAAQCRKAAAELSTLRTAADRMAWAIRSMVDGTSSSLVGGGDGNTYVIREPSPASLAACCEALALAATATSLPQSE